MDSKNTRFYAVDTDRKGTSGTVSTENGAIVMCSFEEEEVALEATKKVAGVQVLQHGDFNRRTRQRLEDLI